jgi:putative MFS transporter
VLFHLPDFFSMSDMGYRMVGMPMSSLMIAGMWLIVGGMLLATWSLVPPATATTPSRAATYHVTAIDDGDADRRALGPAVRARAWRW